MSWQLLLGLTVLAMLIVVLMRPEIFFRLVSNQKKARPRPVIRPVSDEEFKARLTGEPGTVQTETKKEDDHG